MVGVSNVGDRPQVRTLLGQRLEVGGAQFEVVVLVVVGPASPRRRHREGNGLRVRSQVLTDEEILDALSVGPVEDVFRRPFCKVLMVRWKSDKDAPTPERWVARDALEST